jgi:fumarylacetoacetate (FAA) hydrolase
MKLATLKTTHPDGKLVLVSSTNSECLDVTDIAPTMQYALENWGSVESELAEKYQRLAEGKATATEPFDSEKADAPLPRAWQWLDGSLFLNHGHLMQKAFHLDPIEDADKYPLVYQGAGNHFLSGSDDITVADLKHGIDFEGEFGVIVDAIAMGSTPEQCLSKIRLVVLLNDISYRALGPREMKTGFGFVLAKGATAFAPIALTPDELGEYWHNGRVCLPLQVNRNGEVFGTPHGEEMHFGFHELIAHVAQTRPIAAGTVFGSGTVSNADPSRGQACISELRAKEMIKSGAPQTPFMAEDEVVTMNVFDEQGQSLFGAINQRVKVSKANV